MRERRGHLVGVQYIVRGREDEVVRNNLTYRNTIPTLKRG